MTNLFDAILAADIDLFLFLNGINSSFWDIFFYLFSARTTFLLFYIALIYFVIKTSKKRAIWVILSIIVVIILSDQVTSSILKPWIQRFRPSRDPSLEGIVHLVFGKRGGLYGFASSHAANTFGVGTLIALIYRNKLVTSAVIIWAIVTSYSRIYLGVHYPLDVLCGGAIGAFFAAMIYLTGLKTNLILKKQSITATNAYIVSGAFLLTVIIFLIMSTELAFLAR